MWHYPEVVYEKLAMSLSVVCEKGEMKQWRHAKLKSSVEDISRKPWNSDDLTTEVGRRGFNYIMSEHWPSWLLNVDWFTSLFFCKSQTTGFHTTCSNVKVSHWRCRWSIFFFGGWGGWCVTGNHNQQCQYLKHASPKADAALFWRHTYVQ